MIEYYYDTFGRSTGYAINGVRQTTIDYDSFGRISTMTVPATENGENVHSPTPTQSSNSFHWTYLQGSDLKASLAYPNGLTASWTYDANNQLLQVKNTYPSDGLGRDGSPLPSAGVISQFDYTYDAAGRRTAITRSGSAFGDLSGSVDTYTYNARSELTSARRTKNGQPIPGFSEDFDYDPIGNRRSSATYNEKGEAQTSTYQANNLNQYTSRTTPGYAAVRGEAAPEATVTVNENPAFRLGSYYFGSDLFDNSTAGGLANLETYATLGQFAANGEEADDLVSATTNQVYLAQSPDTFAYDDDGNQTLITTKTGLWRVTYNGENRPIRWTREGDGKTVAMPYDHMGRRRTKDGQRFFYDGYLQVANDRTVSNELVRQFFVWDPTEPVATRPLAWFGSNAPPRLYTHDGNKNVSEVVVAASGTNAAVEVVAHYDYAAFGAVIAQKGGCAETNPWRFSSEHEDTELGLDYYNYRHYEPETGRWLQRDLIESKETAQFVGNSPVDKNDRIGLYGNPVSGGGKRYPNRPENWGFDGSAYDECPDGAKVKSLGDGSLAFFRTDIDNFKEKECNGCGAKGGQKFPDSYMGLVDFTGCCNDHDICYGTCGRDKGVCDKNLGDCMRSKCEQALKYVYHEKVLCKTMADAYEKAVSDWGNSAFEAGQDSGCIWRPCCKKK